MQGRLAVSFPRFVFALLSLPAVILLTVAGLVAYMASVLCLAVSEVFEGFGDGAVYLIDKTTKKVVPPTEGA